MGLIVCNKNMLKTKNCLVKLTSQNLINNYGFISLLSKRNKTNVAAVASNPEWDQARPFEEIMKISAFQLIRNSMRGGKFHNKDNMALLQAMHDEYGDLFYMPGFFGRTSKLMTFNPNDFECVFRNEGVWPERPGSSVLQYHREKHRADFFQGVEGLITTHGEKWGTFRSVVNPVLMQPKNVKLFLKKMAQVNLEFVDKIQKLRDPQTLEVPANFAEYINLWTLESVSVVALDKHLGLLINAEAHNEIQKFFKSLTDFFTDLYKLEFGLSLWRYYPTAAFKHAMKTLDDIKQFCEHFINDAIERLEKDRKMGIKRAEHEQSVLEKLLKIDKKIAVVMAMDMLMAGVDTTSSTFAGLMLCLAKNPDKQQTLREEIMHVLPNKDSEFTEQSLNNIPYLRACIKESLRMYPLTLANSRVVQKNVVLSGFRVPTGTEIVLVHTPLLRNEKYFSRPNEYLPERWLRVDKTKAADTTKVAEAKCPNANAALKTSNPFVYLPFGFGPRSCIGKRIVEMELELGAARLIRNFKVEFNHSTENAFKTMLINVPNIPLKFKFTDIA